MSLQEDIRKALKEAMKARDGERTSALRVLIGEFGRQGKKDLSDAEVVSILRKLAKNERETLEKQGAESSLYLEVVESFLPQMASEDDIRAWIEANIDFSRFKNKMQAMRPIMAHFGAAADGNTVRKVLESLS